MRGNSYDATHAPNKTVDSSLYVYPYAASLQTMNTLETDIEIGADGSVRLLSPLPAWLKPGRAHVLLTVETVQELPKHQQVTGKPDFLARQQALFGSRVLPDSQAILDELRADRF